MEKSNDLNRTQLLPCYRGVGRHTYTEESGMGLGSTEDICMRLHHTDRRVKLLWLAAHKSLWEGWVQHPLDTRAYNIIKAMRTAGLFSTTTSWRDVHINNLIQDTRTLLRKQKETK